MTEEIKNQCVDMVMGEGRFGAFHSHQCRRPGKFNREGKWYCKTHDPVEKTRKYNERQAKWKQESDRRKAAWDRETLEHEYCKLLSDEELKRRVDAEDLAK